MSEEFHLHRFDNGLTLLAEPMPWLESAAFSFLLPAGSAHDPLDRPGLANFACEMVQRGCGERDSRRFLEDLENLGVDRGASVGNLTVFYDAAMLAEKLEEVLAIHADLLRRPLLPPEQLEDARRVCLQEIYGVEDDPPHQVMVELRKSLYRDPLARPSYGTEEGIESITLHDIQRHVRRTYQPAGVILGVAGKIEWPAVRDMVERLFGDWEPAPLEPILEARGAGGYRHLEFPSEQVQVAVAYPLVPYHHADYLRASASVGVLSGGMSSRLFDEIREKRGLCYSVYASTDTTRNHGNVVCYAGTSTDRAQETLDVMLAELRKLGEGVRPDELRRLKTIIKSGLVMRQESSRSRAGGMAIEYYFLGRVRSLDEITRLIDALTCETINEFLTAHPPEDFTVVTLGSEPLEVALGVS